MSTLGMCISALGLCVLPRVFGHLSDSWTCDHRWRILRDRLPACSDRAFPSDDWVMLAQVTTWYRAPHTERLPCQQAELRSL